MTGPRPEEVARRLVGRADELRRLHDTYRRAREGAGGLVLVTGEAGIGKTTLVEAALTTADPAPTVLRGTCREGAEAPGFWPWAEVVRAAGEGGLLSGRGTEEEAARALLPTDQPAPAAPLDLPRDRFQVFDAVGRLLRRLADDAPVAVVLEDLQWADPGTLRLLAFLAADLPRSRLLVVATMRDGHPPSGLASRAVTVPVGPLTEPEVGRLVARTAPDRAGAAGRIYRRCGGNPFLVRQLSLAGEDAELPAGARDLLRERIDRLPGPVVEVLELAAVAGPEVSATVLRRAGDLSAENLARALDAAAATGIIEQPLPGLIRFGHDLFREALEQGLDSLTRANLHGRVADALEATVAAGTPGLAADLARHQVESAWLGDPARPLPYLRRAADDATARLAFEEAAAHLAEGARLAGLAGQSATRRSMLLDLADAHRRAGDLTEARAGYLDAAQDARRHGDPDAIAAAALGLHAIGSSTWTAHDTQISVLGEALAARARTEDATTARLLAALAREFVHGTPDRQRAESASERAVAIARGLDRPEVLADCLLARHDVVWWPGSARLRLGILAEVAACAGADGRLAWQAAFGRFVALLEQAEPAAYPELDRVEQLAERLGEPHYRWVARTRRAVVALLTGHLDDAERLIREVGSLAERLGEPDRANVLGDLSAQLAGLRGQLGEIRRWLSQVPTVAPLAMATIEARAALEGGDPETALDRLRPWLDLALSGPRGWQQLGHLALAAQVAAAAGDRPLAEQAYRLLLPHAEGLVVTGGAIGVAGPVSLYLGLAAASLGDHESAQAHLDTAVSVAARLDARPWVAQARVELAALLSRRGAADRAEAALRAAVAQADEVGMPALAARARALLADLSAPESTFRRVDDVWTLAFGGQVVQLPDAKGLRDIARLLAAPGRDVPAAGLLDPEAGAEARLGSDPVLDETARRAYRRRLNELAEQVAAAEAAGDADRSERLRTERAQLVATLAGAYGLGGRARRLGDSGERARKAVTARIRDSLTRIEQRHPELGRHLRESIVTGSACSYRPVEAVRWWL